MKVIKKNFQEMPLLLKLFLVLDVVSVLRSTSNLITNQAVEFNYFNSQFPSAYPYIWHTYVILISVFGLFVLYKRSYSLMIKYLLIGLVMQFIGIINMIYNNFLIEFEQQLLMTIISIGFSLIPVLIFLYYYKQKKYFNKP